MKLSQLRYFKTVAELGKIQAAAEALYISAPALSATIASLEKELGVTLFNRTSNRIVLNEQGKILLRYVNQIFNNIDCAKLELQQSLEEREKRINIAMATSELWTPLFSAFALEFPDIMISQVALKINQLHNVNLSRLHTFVFAERNEFYAADVESVCLFQEHPVAMVPVNHPLAKRDVIELKELENEILFLPYADHSLNKRIRELFYINQIPLKHTHEGAGSASRNMVAQGRGITITTSHPYRVNVPSACYVPIHAPECRWEQHVFWNKDHVFSQEELQFREFVLDMYCGLTNYTHI